MLLHSKKDAFRAEEPTMECVLGQALSENAIRWLLPKQFTTPIARPGVLLPDALERKYTRAATQRGWFWIFPSDHESTAPRSGIVRRHHIYEQTLQRAIKRGAEAARLTKRVATHVPVFVCHSSSGIRLRHSNRSGTARAQLRVNHNDLSACLESWRTGRDLAD